MVSAEYPGMALDPHSTSNNQENSNNLERRNSQQRIKIKPWHKILP